ncbi:hypothetical protein SAMN02745130_03972 [Thiothrix eikelboomii]|uniref:Uncharacterized protein n=1 Tax=Thiothrix eikelboomii TaxID=92487 RepID=A0A1T4Y6U5_9GAMM|nr:hypothetical protein [Thiothrix eikelboomii]SKA97248.1 hypothetical protein SAMN02745130_03972 [Thiothrix eikelboomii]
MTTLLSWVGIDTHGPASVYIASDSRISWGSSQQWDVGRKVFASKTSPEIFGYCGNVSFPIQILGQLIELIDTGCLFEKNDSHDIKLNKIIKKIESSYHERPVVQRGVFHIIYATRISDRMNSVFHAYQISSSSKGHITYEEFNFKNKSHVVVALGSGQKYFESRHDKWVGKIKEDPHDSGRSSRNVFSAFCDSLKAGEDKMSGGSPQLIGLYRVGAAKSFGVIYENNRYLNGIRLDSITSINNIEWRNILFERCCGHTMKILGKAQRQPKLMHIEEPN